MGKLLLVKSSKFIVYGVVTLFLLLYLPTTNYSLLTVHAIVDPLSVPNNKFGIHIISASPDESSPAASLVNTNGDWGYITFLIESKDRNHEKWQEFFNDLRRRHLIPIVRLATKPLNAHWERPYEGEEQAWADFLDRLNWPVKNRYIIIYNEPNHGKEWGNFVDPKMYAEVLDKTITALKSKNRDFFVLNAGFDASTPHQPPNFEEEVSFLQQMNSAVPGIFNRLDGWVSHSYPNPEFIGSPDAFGRGTVRTWQWELQQLRNLGVTKNLPVFITETGWKHSQGINYNPNFPSPEVVASYFIKAFNEAWNNAKIVSVTPFLLNYQHYPFDYFSFKSSDGRYHTQYQSLKNLSKTQGQPLQEYEAKLSKGEVYSSIVAGEIYNISLTLKNTGQSIWGDPLPSEQVRLVSIQGGSELGIQTVEVPKGAQIEPGEEYTFNFSIKAPDKGVFGVKLNLFAGEKQFESQPVEFTTEVKQPVILQILSTLKWKDNFAGDYILRVNGAVGDSSQKVVLDTSGKSAEVETRFLLPDYAFEFSLEKPYYYSKTIHQTVKPGVNTLDFGTLQPALLPALLNPPQLWQLLPFSN